MDEHPAIGLILIFLLTLINALISAAEAAITGVNEANVRKRAQEGDKRSERIVRYIDSPNKYINVIEIVATAISIVSGMVYSKYLSGYIRGTILGAFLSDKPGWVGTLIMVLFSLLLVYIIVLFGVLLPKRLSSRHPEKYAYRLFCFTGFFAGILHPFNWLLEKNVNLLLRIGGIDPFASDDNVTEEEIISIVNEGQEQGVLDDDEAEMISNIIEFDEKQAKDIMTHRKKIVAISDEMDVESAMEFCLNESFSRFPLYKDDIDNIIGVINIKDVMKACLDEKTRHMNIASIARDPYFIPDTQNIDVLFKDMQSKKFHIAIAIDEYGQTAGLVAMEDILEEIVGDIQDEYDDEEEPIVEDGDGFIVRGFANLDEIEEETGLEVEEEDGERFDTLNGLLIFLLDRIPVDGETASIEYNGFDFEILEVKDKMIDKVRIKKCETEAEPSDDECASDAKD